MNKIRFYIGSKMFQFETQLKFSDNKIAIETILHEEIKNFITVYKLNGKPQNISLISNSGKKLASIKDFTKINNLEIKK